MFFRQLQQGQKNGPQQTKIWLLPGGYTPHWVEPDSPALAQSSGQQSGHGPTRSTVTRAMHWSSGPPAHRGYPPFSRTCEMPCLCTWLPRCPQSRPRGPASSRTGTHVLIGASKRPSSARSCSSVGSRPPSARARASHASHVAVLLTSRRRSGGFAFSPSTSARSSAPDARPHAPSAARSSSRASPRASAIAMSSDTPARRAYSHASSATVLAAVVSSAIASPASPRTTSVSGEVAASKSSVCVAIVDSEARTST